MAQATGIQALARAAAARRAALPGGGAQGAGRVPDAPAARRPHHRPDRRRALPPVLVRAAPLHLQRVPAIAHRAARLRPARARRGRAALYDAAEPEAREVPLSDVGDWSRYSYRGAESTHEYHELLRELLQSMLAEAGRDLLRRPLSRLPGRPARADVQRPRATAGELTAIRFRVSKLSHVEVNVFRGGRLVRHELISSRADRGAIEWTPPAPGSTRCGWPQGAPHRRGPQGPRFGRDRGGVPARGVGWRRWRRASSCAGRAASGRRAWLRPRRRCAAAGRRTVVLSTDPAHSLSDSLEVALGAEPAARPEPLRPGGAGSARDGAPLGRRPGLARRPARRAGRDRSRPRS